jgi:predicted dithiol-disulfide oxidoreductase (DUF899 family)
MQNNVVSHEDWVNVRLFNGIPIHLKHRDVAFTGVSRAPLAKIERRHDQY